MLLELSRDLVRSFKGFLLFELERELDACAERDTDFDMGFELEPLTDFEILLDLEAEIDFDLDVETPLDAEEDLALLLDLPSKRDKEFERDRDFEREREKDFDFDNDVNFFIDVEVCQGHKHPTQNQSLYLGKGKDYLLVLPQVEHR
jgi:hypothetical protein